MRSDEREVRRARRFGWTALLLWAVGGLLLETAHGLKLAPYLDDELTRLLLTLAHAHGVGLALVVLVYGAAGVPMLATREDGGRAIGRLLRVAAVLVPLGFGLGAVAHPEGDPSVAIVLVPIGALVLLVALARLAWAAWRA
jgi:hypothetical protein